MPIYNPQDTSKRVPYTGATGNIDIGSNRLLTQAGFDSGGGMNLFNNVGLNIYSDAIGAVDTISFSGQLAGQALISLAGATAGAILDINSLTTANKTFTFPDKSGTFALTSGVPLILFDHYADANNSGTNETDLYSDTLVAGQLANNGEKVHAHFAGTYAGDATSTQRLRVYFGGTLILDTGALAIGANTDSWSVEVNLIRESSSIVRCSVEYTSDFLTLPGDSKYVKVTGLTLSNTQVLKVTGQAAGATGASNQITASQGFVEWKPAA